MFRFNLDCPLLLVFCSTGLVFGTRSVACQDSNPGPLDSESRTLPLRHTTTHLEDDGANELGMVCGSVVVGLRTSASVDNVPEYQEDRATVFFFLDACLIGHVEFFTPALVLLTSLFQSKNSA
ncbi:hypothetical protein Bbelb_277780 [Branchiostoma belcheri]|nr:hypothetical protein Bbelb_277780 [Branchiostoma belcheri]